MLAIFKKRNSPASDRAEQSGTVQIRCQACKDAGGNCERLLIFQSWDSMSFDFSNSAVIAFSQAQKTTSSHQRMFCGVDGIYCTFIGSLHNLSGLIKQYGLSKSTNEAMFVIEAYRTLRDRSPYPADQVLKELDGSYGFVIYDSTVGTAFVSLSADDGVKLYWVVAADGSVVICDNKSVVKGGCAKSYAPFPAGCMFSQRGRVEELRASDEEDEGHGRGSTVKGFSVDLASRLIHSLRLTACQELGALLTGSRGARRADWLSLIVLKSLVLYMMFNQSI
ncbi:unnamed protein product [Rhodiola kirilowii]